MASRLARLEEELTCPVCRDLFKHPVLLSCSHSFCKGCLQRWWTGRPTHECPVCRRTSSSDHPPTNLVLNNLCENFLEEKRQSESSVSSEVVCVEHGEKLRLFCLDDKQLACLVCRDSEKHAGHKFSPVDEASGRCKEKVQELLKTLREKLEVFDQIKTNYDETENHIKVQAHNTETQIKEQFNNLHYFLQEEEETRISILRVEEAHKSLEIEERIEDLIRDMATLSDAIRATEDQLRADDHVSFLQSYRTTMERVHLTLQDPPPLSGALIDEAKHLGNLAFRVWDKMKDIVSYTPVILDPNTAPTEYSLSDDLTGVRYLNHAESLTELPDNPERFGYFSLVLGSVGFNSGSHSWDLEVGDNTNWALGVLAESFERNGEKGGEYWNIDLYEGQHRVLSSGTAFFVLPVKRKPRRIRVQLDWDGGQLSFSDPDTDTHLHTFTHTFTETLFPYILNFDHYEGMSVKVLPVKICVTLENN